MNKHVTALIGLGAFVIGGLLARQSAIEGIELLEETIDNKLNRRPAPPEAE